MAKLSDLLSTREITMNQTNLEKGKVWVVASGSMYSCIRSDHMYCWLAPGCGTLTIEAWGAAGSGSRMCCCGFGLPGNAPGYSKKTIAVWPGSYICGCPGQACPAGSLCFDGCGVPTYVRWGCARDLCGYMGGCMCAQGGRGGTSICSTGTSAYCCFTFCTFCTTQLSGANCGIVCNQCPGGWIGCGYGGDINCCGCVSMAMFKGCNPICPCQTEYFVPVAAGIFAEQGGYFIHTQDADPEYTQWSGGSLKPAQHTLNGMSKSPTGGMPWGQCYNGQQTCGCYEAQGCYVHMPYGVGGRAPMPCPDVRDHGGRGGNGAIRLTYRGTGTFDNQRLNQQMGGAY